MKTVKKEAEAIDDDGVFAALIRLFVEPWPIFVGELVYAKRITLTELSRSQGIRYIEDRIKSAEKLKNSL